jgi:hypothetical protein
VLFHDLSLLDIWDREVMTASSRDL